MGDWVWFLYFLLRIDRDFQYMLVSVVLFNLVNNFFGTFYYHVEISSAQIKFWVFIVLKSC